MDFLHFGSVSFQPNTNIGHLCEELNNMVGNAIWNDCMSNLFAYNLHAPKQLAICKLYTNYCSVHPYKTKFLLKHSSVVNNLTACFKTYSVVVNCVLKPALQVSSHNVLISCVNI